MTNRHRSLMKVRAPVALLTAVLIASGLSAAMLAFAARPGAGQARAPDTGFIAVDIFVDPGDVPLAAYQIEFIGTSPAGPVRLVGVEGGEHPAFAEPPYYDPKALSTGRVIIAALSTDADLPTGQTRVARLHLEIPADSVPAYRVVLAAAGTHNADPIAASATAAPADLNTATPSTESGDP